MLYALQSSRALDALGRGQLSLATREISEKFSADLAKRPMYVRLHESISLPLKDALDAGHRAVMLKKYEGGQAGDWYFVQLGENVFPMRARQREAGHRFSVPTELQLFPAIKAKKLDIKAMEREGPKAIYGKPLDEIDRISLLRESGPTTHVRFNNADVELDRSYGWALWESSASLIRRAVKVQEANSAMVAFDPVIETTVTLPRRDPYGKVARQLIDSIDAPNSAKAPSIPGPQPADDLLAAFSWNGKPVVVTSQRPVRGPSGEVEQPPVKLWTLEKRKNELLWVDVPPPANASLPAHGVSVVLEGNTLHLVGGTGKDGEPVNTHFTYDLGAASRDRHRADLWTVERPLDETVAWPAAIATERELFLSGGVAGFYTKQGDVPERVLSVRRDLRIYTRQGKKQRDALPIEDRGGSAAYGQNAVFVGPGVSQSGRVFAYDLNKDGALIELPSLPKGHGLGQLSFEGGSRLLYFGGVGADGKVSKAIWELDLSDIQGTWNKLGDSDFAQGPARVINAYGNTMSLMIAPGKSAGFYVDLAGGNG